MITTADHSEAMLHLARRATPDRFMNWLTSGQFQRPPHVRFMGEKLAKVAEGNQRIILQVTVRHGKSEIGSLATPLWFLDLFPDKNVGLATYQANFSARWGRRVRNLIQRFQSQLRVQVADDSAAAHSWETTAGGGLHTAGVGGEFTGRGFHLFVIDDPVKNAEEANSEVYREKVWDWYQTTIRTRLEPGGSIVLIMARWHEDDLAGRLIADMKNGGEQWEVIDIPAIAGENDPLGRKPGEPLWPARYDLNDLNALKRAVGPRAWSALYQQRPTPDDGGMFKREYFRYYDDEGDYYVLHEGERDRKILKSDCWRFMVADTAMTEKTSADYTVIQVWDVEKITASDGETVGGAMVLVDQFRAQVETPTVEAQMLKWHRKYKPIFIGIENKASGTVIIQRFKRDGIPVRGIEADKDKVTRATIAEIWMSNGKVYFPQDADYLTDLEKELLIFPNGTHDDQVDTVAHGVSFANRRDMWVEPPKPKLPPNSYGALLGMEEVFNDTRKRGAFTLHSHK